MKQKDEEKLLMIYLNEALQEEIDECLKSTELCAQLDQLEADMNAIEQRQIQHQLPADYGQQLWNQIADELVVEKQPDKTRDSLFSQMINWLMTPQYSLAGLVLVAGLIMVAFFAGKNQSTGAFDSHLQEQLLAQNISLHLTQSEIFLTQVSNDNGTFDSQTAAQRLLSSNRIFKQALANHDSQFTHQILQDLEPILLEYANGSLNSSTQSHGNQPQVKQPGANWVSDNNASDLMFQIKAMKQQLSQKNDII